MDKRIDYLLKSGLLLEHEVSAIADQCGFYNCGEFTFGRTNESGSVVDFSVDLLVLADSFDSDADREGEGKALNVLIECKYASPTVEWVFSKVPKHEPMVLSGLSTFHWLGDYFVQDLDRLLEIEPEHYCTRGVSLSMSSADPKQIQHGLQQLRHSLPNLLQSFCSFYKNVGAELPIPLLGSLLVTNAPIRVLKEDVNISSAAGCKSLDEISTVHNYVSVYQKASPELRALCDKVSSVIVAEHPDVKNINLERALVSDLVDCVESVTVITLSYLPTYLMVLHKLVSELGVISHRAYAENYIALTKG